MKNCLGESGKPHIIHGLSFSVKALFDTQGELRLFGIAGRIFTGIFVRLAGDEAQKLSILQSNFPINFPLNNHNSK